MCLVELICGLVLCVVGFADMTLLMSQICYAHVIYIATARPRARVRLPVHRCSRPHVRFDHVGGALSALKFQ